MAETGSVNVWLGSELGILKAVNLVGKTATNYYDQAKVGKENEIVSMHWTDKKHSGIYTGFKHGIIREFNMETGQFGPIINAPDFQKGAESLVKVYRKDDSFVTCTSKGKVAMWKATETTEISTIADVNVGPNLYDMAINQDGTKFATGGKENALKVYDFENLEEPIFKAKNVTPDWLQLRVPIWVTGIRFLESPSKIVTCTGTSKVRLYDITTEQRRPCLEMNFDEYPLTAITLTHNENQVIVSNTRGSVGMFDFRNKGLVRVFKGFAGSVRYLECHPTLDYVASCGLDRYLRIHDTNSGKLEYKVYLKARLNCVMFSDLDFVADAKKASEEENEAEFNRKRKLEEVEEGDENDPMWRRMKTVDENESEDSGSSSEEEY